MSRVLKTTENTTVLVVEDEARLRDVLTASARECGFKAGAARCAEEALEAMEKKPRDIVLLDLNLPGMDGLSCIEILRQRWPATAVVILTGFGTLAAAQKAIRLGVIEFLTKPASLGDIEQALHRAWRVRFDVGEDEFGGTAAATTGDGARHRRSGAPKTLRDIQFHCILEALERHGGNRAAAATELGISERKLYYWLVEYRRAGGTGKQKPAE
ncbi:MAG: response regulator transcription factor [Phycisphaerae bacterium]